MDTARWPAITVVTTSFNQAQFLEETLRSVLLQGYPNLEYLVLDGGSTDGSVELLEKYSPWLAYWTSGPDGGVVPAANAGLRRATGEWIGWQCSDDIYFPGCFQALTRAAVQQPEADLIIGNVMLIDENSRSLREMKYVRPTHNALLAEGMVLTQQAAFWKRSVHSAIGWLDEAYDCAVDYEWFLRLTRGRHSVHVNALWAGYRVYGTTKSVRLAEQFHADYRRILAGREFPGWKRRLYQTRRLLLLLANGELGYVLKGLARRAAIAVKRVGGRL